MFLFSVLLSCYAINYLFFLLTLPERLWRGHQVSHIIGGLKLSLCQRLLLQGRLGFYEQQINV